jgi:hypothetical protein
MTSGGHSGMQAGATREDKRGPWAPAYPPEWPPLVLPSSPSLSPRLVRACPFEWPIIPSGPHLSSRVAPAIVPPSGPRLSSRVAPVCPPEWPACPPECPSLVLSNGLRVSSRGGHFNETGGRLQRGAPAERGAPVLASKTIEHLFKLEDTSTPYRERVLKLGQSNRPLSAECKPVQSDGQSAKTCMRKHLALFYNHPFDSPRSPHHVRACSRRDRSDGQWPHNDT